MNFFDNFKKENLIAAHRGYSHRYPENTMIAFEHAIGKSDLIEFDVQFTKDNVPIIFHDEVLTRTSNVTSFKEFAHKKPYNICDFDYEELLKLDFSSWFTKNKTDKIEKILRLDELLSFARNNSVYMNLEIKDLSSVRSFPSAVEQILEAIIHHDCESQVLISSFNHEYLRDVKKLNCNIPTAALVYKHHPENLIPYLKELKVSSYNIDNETITKDLVKSLKEEGIFVNVYTANLKIRKKELFDMGVKIVFTDCLD